MTTSAASDANATVRVYWGTTDGADDPAAHGLVDLAPGETLDGTLHLRVTPATLPADTRPMDAAQPYSRLAACQRSSDIGGHLGVRGESPRAVDDHTDGDPDLVSVGHRLNYAVAQPDRLCEHAVDTNIGVLGAGRSRCRQRRISDSSQREGEEICIDISGQRLFPPPQSRGRHAATSRAHASMAFWP